MSKEDVWYKEHGCWHAHCPDGCEKPQPFVNEQGKMVCGRCFFKFGEVVEMIPCIPEICGE